MNDLITIQEIEKIILQYDSTFEIRDKDLPHELRPHYDLWIKNSTKSTRENVKKTLDEMLQYMLSVGVNPQYLSCLAEPAVGGRNLYKYLAQEFATGQFTPILIQQLVFYFAAIIKDTDANPAKLNEMLSTFSSRFSAEILNCNDGVSAQLNLLIDPFKNAALLAESITAREREVTRIHQEVIEILRREVDPFIYEGNQIHTADAIELLCGIDRKKQFSLSTSHDIPLEAAWNLGPKYIRMVNELLELWARLDHIESAKKEIGDFLKKYKPDQLINAAIEVGSREAEEQESKGTVTESDEKTAAEKTVGRGLQTAQSVLREKLISYNFLVVEDEDWREKLIDCNEDTFETSWKSEVEIFKILAAVNVFPPRILVPRRAVDAVAASSAEDSFPMPFSLMDLDAPEKIAGLLKSEDEEEVEIGVRALFLIGITRIGIDTKENNNSNAQFTKTLHKLLEEGGERGFDGLLGRGKNLLIEIEEKWRDSPKIKEWLHKIITEALPFKNEFEFASLVNCLCGDSGVFSNTDFIILLMNNACAINISKAIEKSKSADAWISGNESRFQEIAEKIFFHPQQELVCKSFLSAELSEKTKTKLGYKLIKLALINKDERALNHILSAEIGSDKNIGMNITKSALSDSDIFPEKITTEQLIKFLEYIKDDVWKKEFLKNNSTIICSRLANELSPERLKAILNYFESDEERKEFLYKDSNILSGHHLIIKFLLEHPRLCPDIAKINDSPLDSNHPLFYAVTKRNINSVIALVEGGVAVNKQDASGSSLLHFVKEAEVSNYLLARSEMSALLNQQNKDGLSPLSKAVIDGRIGVIAPLISAGADIKLCNTEGDSLLHLAKSKEAIECLVSYTEIADIINYRNNNGASPLEKAALKNDLDCVRALVDAGARIEVEYNSESGDRYHNIFHCIRSQTVADFLFLKISPLGLDIKAIVNKPLIEVTEAGRQRPSPLDCAVLYSDAGYVKRLISYGAVIDPLHLHMASDLGVLEELFVENLVSDMQMEDIIEYFAKNSRYDEVKFLLKKCDMPQNIFYKVVESIKSPEDWMEIMPFFQGDELGDKKLTDFNFLNHSGENLALILCRKNLSLELLDLSNFVPKIDLTLKDLSGNNVFHKLLKNIGNKPEINLLKSNLSFLKARLPQGFLSEANSNGEAPIVSMFKNLNREPLSDIELSVISSLIKVDKAGIFRDHEGCNALHYIKHIQGGAPFNNLIRSLIAKADEMNCDRETPLTKIVKNPDISYDEKIGLLHLFADLKKISSFINSRDASGNSLLHHIVPMKESDEKISLFRGFGNLIEAANFVGHRPITSHAQKSSPEGNKEIVALLKCQASLKFQLKSPTVQEPTNALDYIIERRGMDFFREHIRPLLQNNYDLDKLPTSKHPEVQEEINLYRKVDQISKLLTLKAKREGGEGKFTRMERSLDHKHFYRKILKSYLEEGVDLANIDSLKKVQKELNTDFGSKKSITLFGSEIAKHLILYDGSGDGRVEMQALSCFERMASRRALFEMNEQLKGDEFFAKDKIKGIVAAAAIGRYSKTHPAPIPQPRSAIAVAGADVGVGVGLGSGTRT